MMLLRQRWHSWCAYRLRLKRAKALARNDAVLAEAQLSQALRWGDNIMKNANLSRQQRRQLFRDAAHSAETLSDFVLEVMRRAGDAV